MFEPLKEARQQAKELVEKGISAAIAAGRLPDAGTPEFSIEIPGDSSHGDLASNAALAGARLYRMAPPKIAAAILEGIDLSGSLFSRVEMAGAGFINFFLGDRYFTDLVNGINREGRDFGRTGWGGGKRYMVEFVSANPTGPMHLGNARGGALGDCLASVLEAAGCQVTREFYVNDAGNQIAKFGMSLEARYQQIYDPSVEFPEDGYHGEDIKQRAREFADIHGDRYLSCGSEERRAALVDYALPLNIEGLKTDLEKYRIHYDVWFRESELYRTGTVDKVIEILKSRGLTYMKDGALWYKATEHGGEKDEVLVRNNGIPTYFAGDIAYHYNKFAERGFDRVVNVWGADHHGHVARLKGAMDAIGLDGDKLDILLMQMVNLMSNGEPIRMSKRTGKAIGLATLLDEISVDAARFFFNLREPKTHLDFDLDLAVKNNSDNPVYYVQYAHARICSILKGLEACGVDLQRAKQVDCSTMVMAEELALMNQLARFPEEVDAAAETYDPSRITRYTVELAAKFHKFYGSCRCRGEAEEIMYPRVALCLAAGQVLENALAMLKVDAPTSM